MARQRDHGGGLDAARDTWGGTDWLDLSTGINPNPYPLPAFAPSDWTALPDRDATTALNQAARRFWQVPEGADLLAAPGLSSVIAALPSTFDAEMSVDIPAPTYNEHAAAWAGHKTAPGPADVRVLVHPNNPDGRIWQEADFAPITIVDESFCDVMPEASLVRAASRPNVVILKSFGKFWGLAGLRLGFAIGDPTTIGRLRDRLGPWPVSGPALRTGTAALSDPDWADATRHRLARDARRLDGLMARHGALVGGTDLFRLYEVDDSRAFQDRLARSAIWSRIFPYSDRWVRLGLPPSGSWDRVEGALA
ncbi:threonine-phosphate decarboxylase [Jannaschia sp. 2305UL9-9]|uniref:threonine-phosphate decarboxylase n=1 Tax=Jannaschia sp. 2305UL9-9 TaxID=3121638 RepID=UPI00352800FB